MKKTVCTDYLVTGKTFVLEPHKTYEILQTTPQPKQLDRYYKHPNYISHRLKGRSLFFTFYAFLRQLNHKYKIKLMHKHLSTKGKLLDFGAGTGSFVKFAQKKGWNAMAYEPNYNAHNPEVTYVKEWFKVSYCNAITAWHVIEHLRKPKAFLQQAYDSLQKDGKMFVALPNFKSWDAKKYGADWAGYDVPRHLWHFSPKGFIDMSEDCGFVVEKTYPLVFDAYYVSFISEKNKQSSFAWLKAICAGWRSNQAAKHTQNHSSVIFVLKKGK
ncbi:MAG: class I SAM-dependent methyltransferase [Bacteroidota bacterium]|nr:class I SAM-dependent methyltransferase [Bacteroidota bacterium]MED5362957.1 class I SAM-dependent methyltransferase [Bacteroidota bacterium]